MKQFKTISQNKADIEIGYKEQKQHLIDMMALDEKLGLYEDGSIGYNKQAELVKQLASKLKSEGETLYSKEDLKNAFLDGWQLRDGDLPFPKAKNKWFEQFKNK